MNVEKVVAALRQTDQLTCGGLVFSGGRCAIGQLFFAAGKSEDEIGAEEDAIGEYICMFNGLLSREYNMSLEDTDAACRANDEGLGFLHDFNDPKQNCARRDHMIEWVENYVS